MKAILLCAGLGTRLGPLTADRPKALLTVGGVPLVIRSLEWLAGEGVREVLINLHYRGADIADAVSDRFAGRINLTYRQESELLGTAGTVRANRSWFGAEDVLVVYGDLVTDQPVERLVALHHAASADATLLVHRRSGSNSIVHLDEDRRVVSFRERPGEPGGEEHWVFSGIGVLGPRAVDRIPERAPADLPRDLFEPLAAQLRLFALPLTGRRVAVDSPARLEEAERVFGGSPGH